MKIKVGTIKQDKTSYGNVFWIQIEDSEHDENYDLIDLVDKTVSIAIEEREQN